MITRIHLFLNFLLCLLLLGAAGCGSADSGPPPAPTQGQGTRTDAGGRFPLTVTDGLGRQVTLSSAPQRIVSLAPKNTELMFAIGAGEKLVGVTTYCNYPPEAVELPKVGGFSSHSISLEKVISLRPDLVLSVGELHRSTIEQLERLHVPVLALGAESLRELYAELELLGRATHREPEAARLIETMEHRVSRIRDRARTIPLDERVKVFYQAWEDPLIAAGPTSFIGELIETAGGENIVSESSTAYPRISEEILLERNPDVIIAPSMGESRIRRGRLLERPAWSEIRAVQNGRIYVLDGDLVSRCGPRLVDALEAIAHQLYPERFESRPEMSNADDGHKRRASP